MEETDISFIDEILPKVTPLLEEEGMTEAEAENYMQVHWGKIPNIWRIPGFRDLVTGKPGQAELDGHMNWGGLTYGGKTNNPNEAAGIWYRRNIEGQGHPAEGPGGWTPTRE